MAPALTVTAQAQPAIAPEIADEGAREAERSAGIPALIPTKDFAARSAFWDAELATDGTAMTYVQRTDKKLRLITVDPLTGDQIDTLAFAPGTYVEWTRWVSKDKMLINLWAPMVMGPYIVKKSRLILAYPREGRFHFLVDQARSLNGGNVIHVDEDGEYALIAHRGDGRFYYPSLYRYELKKGGAVTKLEDPIKGVTGWMADKNGVVRLATGWWKRRLHVYYRSKPGGKLERIAKIKPGDEDGYFDTLAILSNDDRGYVLDEGEDGRVGLRIYDYAKREVVETVYEDPDWDIERALLKDGKPLAVFYTDDRQQVVWFDDEYEAIYAELREASEGRDVWVQGRSKDGQKMLVWAGNEGDPGVLYFFDRSSQTLREVARYRPQIDASAMAMPKPVSYTARDGTPIRAYLTLPKGRDPQDLPLIIHPHGGPFGVRDELRYDDQVQFLANRGYAVLQPNFRGSGGYGNDFYDLGEGQVGRGMQDDLDDAMDWAVEQGIADPARVCIVGGSYGGYAALWGVLRNPDRYRCAASWAGVTDWTSMLQYDRRVMTRQAGKRWSARIEGSDEDFDLKDVSPYRLASGLQRPVLLAHGTADDNVPFKQYEQMLKAARKAPVPLTTLVIEGAGHSFFSSDSEQKWYDALDRFLAEHNPADQVDGDGVFAQPVSPEADTSSTTITEAEAGAEQ